MKIITKILALAIGAVALFSVSAQAATFNVNLDDPLVLGTLAADDTTGNVLENVSGSVNGLRRSPWDTTSNKDATYTSIGANSTAGYNFSSLVSGISFLWGSIDHWNKITFLNDGKVVDTLFGDDVYNNSIAIPARGYANIDIIAAASFNRVVFESTPYNAFEFANLQVSAVPLPAALPLYGAGVAVLGFMGWRRRRNAA
ncbi:MAG: VPLPA-CTERM sorting domain-containing protein [Sneathiella sp.]